MRIAIMQPYFFPYIGYFQLINNVDKFIIYDNVKFTKKGWINRNRILVNHLDSYISLPLKKDSDFLKINQRLLSRIWHDESKKILNRLSESYRKAPYFDNVYPLIEKCIVKDESNLFNFLLNSIEEILFYLTINTKIIVSSSINIDHSLKSEDKVLAICKALSANEYINPVSGIELYSKQRFDSNGIKLIFQKPIEINYNQFNNKFVPSLSIIDVIMFNSIDEVKNMLNEYVFL